MRRRPASLAAIAVAGILAGLLGLVALAGPASAHASLESTSPAAGDVLDKAPKEASVTFDEGVRAAADGLQLHDAAGRRVDVGAMRHSDGGKVLSLPLGDLGDGGYVLTWRVVSADGHPISGGVTWRIGASSTAVDQGILQGLLDAEGGSSSVHVVAAVFRTLLFASMLLLVGGLVFLVAVWPDGAGDERLRPTLRAAAAVAGLATVAGMGLQGADVAGLGLAHAFNLGTALDTLDGSYGQAAVARLVLLVVLAALAARATPIVVRRVGWQLATLGSSAALLATLSFSGHARTGRWLAFAVPLDLVHLGAAATWIGGLFVLTAVVLPRIADDAAVRITARFSSVAAACVGAVVATGVVQGFRQLGGFDGLRTTAYGRLLVIKIVVVSLVVVLGALSRSLVRAPDPEPLLVRTGGGGGGGGGGDAIGTEGDVGDDGAPADPGAVRRALRRSVGAEAVIAVVVLAVTSLLVAANPSRSVEAKAFNGAKVVDGSVVEAFLAPSRTGPVDFHVYVTDPTVGLTTQLGATATMSLPSRGIPAIQIPLRPAGRSHWSAYDVDIPISGDWELDVAVTVGEFDQRQATFTVPID